MKKLLSILLIIFFNVIAYSQLSKQNSVTQEVVGRDTITWVLRENLTIWDIYIEKDRNRAIEYKRNHPNTLAKEITEVIEARYFNREGTQRMESILLGCFSEDDLSKLFKKMSEKSRLRMGVFLQGDGTVLSVDICAFAPITKSEFLTSTEVYRFMNNVKKSSFPDLQELPFMYCYIPIWQHHIKAELERRTRSK
ncbi:MAG: hypothetical protein LBN93_02655 [Candidatus Symbiothrix sp.]|nr:hypothetical protein [Candidatus Symbiothrix sp.]